jgi:hypothetical protein
MNIGNDSALRIGQENGLTIRDLYNEAKTRHIGRKRVCRGRYKRGRALIQFLDRLFADEIYRIAMDLAAGNEPFESNRILYAGKVFPHSPGRVAVAPGRVKALVGGQAYSAVPCENSMHQPRHAGKVAEGKAGQALNCNILLHRIDFSVTVHRA